MKTDASQLHSLQLFINVELDAITVCSFFLVKCKKSNLYFLHWTFVDFFSVAQYVFAVMVEW